MKAYLCVAAVCLLFVAGTSAVDVSAAKSIVTQTRPITYSATTRIVNDLHAPDTSSMQAARDVVFSDDANEAQNTPHQKVKRATPLHALHQQVSIPAAGETGVTPIHRKKTAWNDEEIQRETIARVTQGIPQLLKQVDSNMHRVRERTLMEGVVNFLQTGEKVFEKETSKESPSQMLRRMKQQLEDLDRRRAKLETVRDSIKEELASKKSSFVARHHVAPRRRSSNDDDPVLVEAASVESPARPLADSVSLDLDVKEWADQARFKQQKNDINNLVTDADNALSSMSARLKLDYE